ncbi:MAG: hypothetical protein F6K22_38100 [Okeania sp. SIO2F4]|uniref:hypothetical protein n=1 Tax=Okeania sp. SIO2F4 TaxID=2607790 RepID=UPI00142ADB74|nr:hypothetical protein [Okeania sp. SIO2F4]NES08085.1 hypothetical protein [Okeania sp. SIO2F4]
MSFNPTPYSLLPTPYSQEDVVRFLRFGITFIIFIRYIFFFFPIPYSLFSVPQNYPISHNLNHIAIFVTSLK